MMHIKTTSDLSPDSISVGTSLWDVVPRRALTRGVPTTMARNLFMFALLLGAATLSLAQSADRSPAWVEQRVREIQPKPEERRLDEIGWAKDIRDALALAKKHQRPVFLFTHDGRINTGRC
jgi:hypothetical protein